MPVINVSRSITIKAAEAIVTPAVADFTQWPAWSPWLYTEPTALVEIHGNAGQPGHGYSWRGEMVGAGSMQLTDASAGHYKMDLTFLKPFKSQARVELETIAIDGETTQVHWRMFSSLPWPMFFMTNMMKGMIGMDYERGLKLLKDYCEHGCIVSSTQLIGIVKIPEIRWIGLADEAKITALGDSMKYIMPQLPRLIREHQLTPSGSPGTVYNNLDLKSQSCRYTAIMPVERNNIDSANAITGTIKPCQALKLVHKGSYSHLGNAWSTAMAHRRQKKLKLLKSQPPFELYPNNPADTPEKNLLSEIYLPIKG